MIRERDRLARSPAHETALACIEAGIEAAHPERVVEDSVSIKSDSLRVADATPADPWTAAGRADRL